MNIKKQWTKEEDENSDVKRRIINNNENKSEEAMTHETQLKN